MNITMISKIPSIIQTLPWYQLRWYYPNLANSVLHFKNCLSVGFTSFSWRYPIMNYEGHTYIPMKAVGDILGASVEWNDELRLAEINYDIQQNGNNAFRNLKAEGSNGKYTITGEARVFEAVMSYAVSDGHSYLFEDFHSLNEGAPAWSAFTLEIEIPQEQLPVNGTLTLEVFEYSANDGSKINILPIPLESFES